MGLGIVFAFTFDTTGPRTRDVVEEERVIPDEDVHDYDDREFVPTAGTTATTTDDDRTMVAAGDSRPERVEISDPERRDTP
jgi:hypothetical protein